MNDLFDTNVDIHFFIGLIADESIHDLLSRSFLSSIMTKIEFPGRSKFVDFPDEYEKPRTFLDNAIVLPLYEPVVEETIRLRQRYRCRTPDAIIAVTARIHGLRVVTNDTHDFARLGVRTFTVRLK